MCAEAMVLLVCEAGAHKLRRAARGGQLGPYCDEACLEQLSADLPMLGACAAVVEQKCKTLLAAQSLSCSLKPDSQHSLPVTCSCSCALQPMRPALMCWSLLLVAQVVQATEQLFASGQLQKPVAKMYEDQACDNRWELARCTPICWQNALLVDRTRRWLGVTLACACLLWAQLSATRHAHDAVPVALCHAVLAMAS